MMHPPRRGRLSCVIIVASFVAGLAPTRSSGQEDLLITEFEAYNTRTLLDENREFSDWLEIFNAGTTARDLEGYYLTDSAEDLRRWRFPAVTLEAGRFLVVFASGKDRREPGSELHTNFRIDKEGEMLVLVAPDGATAVAGFAPFPEQVQDTTYGTAFDAVDLRLLDADTPHRVHVPSGDSLALAWTAPEFDDAGWREGLGAVGFGGASREADLIRTDVGTEMLDLRASVYIRIPFQVDDPAAIDLLVLRVRYDDGFVAFLNGELAATGNAPDPLAWDSEATRSHSAGGFEEFDVSDWIDRLRPGENVLAIQGMNTSVRSSDLFILAELHATDVRAVHSTEIRYFREPTPGRPNRDGFPGITPRPEFSHDGGAFVEPQLVELSTSLAGGRIHFTLDGTLPNENSTVYAEPIRVASANVVTARVFHDALLPGLPEQRTFVILDPSVESFSSNLPVAVAVTFGRTIPPICEGAYTSGHFMIIEPGEDGRTRLADAPSVFHTVGFRQRGSSTCGREKFSFNVETRDDEGGEEDLEFFDWPRHADYAMYGPYNFDRALIRNPLIFELSNEVDQYAPRTRFVECFLHMRPGPVTSANYHGLYVFMERNKRGPGRIEVERLGPQDNAEPEVSGGYVLKVDRADGALVLNAGGLSLVAVHPKIPTAQQRNWLTVYLNQMRSSLNPDSIVARDGEFVDVRSWIDHHILNMYPMNVDAFRLSGYLFKDRGGPVHMGPIWDYDRSMGSDDGRDRDPLDWNGGGTAFFQFGWYAVLFNGRPPIGTTAWEREYIRRWRELRQGTLSTEHIDSVIDRMADEIREAADRNFARWSAVRPRRSPAPLDGTFQGEIEHLKTWLSRRASFIDSHFVVAPVFDPPSSLVERGTQVEISVAAGAVAYYTLDGSDPRGADDRPSASALLYERPIAIERNTRIIARALEGGRLWSGAVQGIFVVTIPELMVTEIMYNPLEPGAAEDPKDLWTGSDMEFLEIQNIGEEPADLTDLRFARGVAFDFNDASVRTIPPGGIVVIVNDPLAFAARYGAEGVPIIGEYRGSLSNSGETIIIANPLGDPILEFRYDGAWYPEAAGGGSSLENVDPLADAQTLNEPAAWRPSGTLHGAPGVVSDAPAPGLQLPGDLTQDGRLNVTDAVRLIRLLIGGDGVLLPCGEGVFAAPGNVALLDGNGDAGVDLADAVYILRFLFQAGPPHALGSGCTRIPTCAPACAE